MTAEELEVIRKQAEAAMKAAPGEWECDGIDNEDGHGKFRSYAVYLSDGRSICDTLNSSIIEIEEEADEYGVRAFDRIGAICMEFIAAANPEAVLALLSALDAANKRADEAEALYKSGDKLRNDALLALSEYEDKNDTLRARLEVETKRADEAEARRKCYECGSEMTACAQCNPELVSAELTTLRARVAELEGAAKLGEAFMSVWQQAQLNHQKYSATGTQENDIRFLTLGLVGEAGELANFIKKRWRDGEGHDADIKLEVADVLAYLMMVAYQFGMFPHELIQTVAHKQEVFVKKMVARDAALAPKEPGNDAG